MNYKILQHFIITDNTTELKLQIEDKKILVIYGRHINGYYIALPNIFISCEALGPEEVSVDDALHKMGLDRKNKMTGKYTKQQEDAGEVE